MLNAWSVAGSRSASARPDRQTSAASSSSTRPIRRPAGRLLHHPGSVCRPTALRRGLRLRQRAVPQRPRRARFRRRPPRPQQLHQDPALARQLAEPRVPRCGSAQGQGTSGEDRDAIQTLLGQHLVVPTALKELGYTYYHVGKLVDTEPTTSTPIDVRVRGSGRVLGGAGPDHAASRLQRAGCRARGPMGLAGPAGEQRSTRWIASTRSRRRPRPEVRLRVTCSPARPVRLRHRRLVHGPSEVDAQGGARELSAAADLRQHAHARARRPHLADSEDAIVVIQADEGPFPPATRRRVGFRWGMPPTRSVEEKFGILFTMRVPGADLEAEGFHDASRRSTSSASSSTPGSGPISRSSPTAHGRTRTSSTSTTSSRSPIGSAATRDAARRVCRSLSVRTDEATKWP